MWYDFESSTAANLSGQWALPWAVKLQSSP
jgi:hypothetical protein